MNRACSIVLQWRAGQLPGRTRGPQVGGHPGPVASMEGRAIARPDHQPIHPALAATVASMEGRAIARPDLALLAGACSGASASMEGRAIARPDVGQRQDLLAHLAASMEGRAIARPDPTVPESQPALLCMLQWRAGQLPGRTGDVDGVGLAGDAASMEGRAIARPDVA